MQWFWWTVRGRDNEPGCFNLLFRVSWPKTRPSRMSTAWRTSTWPSTGRCWATSPSRSTSSSSTLQRASCSPWSVSSHLQVFLGPDYLLQLFFRPLHSASMTQRVFSSPMIGANRDEGFSSHSRRYLFSFCWGGSGRGQVVLVGLLSPPDQVCG